MIENQNTSDTFIGDGVTAVFPSTIYGTSADQFALFLGTEALNGTQLTLTADYTVTNLSDPDEEGVVITCLVAPPVDARLRLYRVTPATQTVNITQARAFDPRVLEEQLDKLTMRLQEVGEETTRSLKIRDTSPPFTPVENGTIIWTPDGFAPGPSVLELEADKAATAADRAQTELDAAATAADRIQTALDAAATANDRVQTGLDATATAADRVQTELDAVATAADRAQVILDAAQTAGDRIQTVADAAATAADRITVAADKATTVAAKDAALVAFANFQDVYMGPFAADPTLDIDGSALDGGELYFNTSTNVMKVYLPGGPWVAAYVSAAGVLLVANDLSDLNSSTAALANLGLSADARTFVTAANYAAMRTALGLGTAATTAATAYATAAQGALADLAAPKASPTLTGVPTAPTATAGTNTTQIATTAFVQAAADAGYESAETAWAVNTPYTFAHGLGARPKMARAVFRCIVAQTPYAVGDEVDFPGIHTTAGVIYGAVVSANAASVVARISNGVYFPTATSGFITATSTNWRIVVRASL